jgi:GNAT superfamily N-acetyltransferase
VENAVRGSFGCGVLVACIEGRPAGFFVLAEDAAARRDLGVGVGTLVLISVDASLRRRGVARSLSWASLDRLRKRGNRFAEVGTQIGNVPASSVYLRSGFTLARTSLSLRWRQGEVW